MTRAEIMARAALNVRPDTLRCYRCGEWLPDEAFHRCNAAVSRRRRNTECKICHCELQRKRQQKCSDRYLSSLACRPQGERS